MNKELLIQKFQQGVSYEEFVASGAAEGHDKKWHPEVLTYRRTVAAIRADRGAGSARRALLERDGFARLGPRSVRRIHAREANGGPQFSQRSSGRSDQRVTR